ncbi:hypothetical protein FZF94_19385 [Salmonella enterica]|nr:hypothetical protein [Salmonella enterica]EEL5139850.1 hypothetical protein [Salmonella enterica]EEN7827211.1 hypothetical protein [Salmonella enterica]
MLKAALRELMKSGDIYSGRMHTTRNGKSARDELPFRPLKWREFITATVQAAHPFTDAASVMWMLRHGMEGGGAKRGPLQRRRCMFCFAYAQIHISCHTCAVVELQAVLINKHRDRNLKPGCQRSHMVKGKITIAIEDTTDK